MGTSLVCLKKLPILFPEISRKDVIGIAVFAIADLHLSLAADKSMEIFSGWQNYVARICEQWKNTVEPEDTVVLPGDLSWAMKLSDTVRDFEFINNLPGKKLIIKGNHDLWWSTVSKMKRFLADNGFHSMDFIHNNAFEIEDMALCGTRGWFFDDDSDPDQKVLLREAMRLEASIAAAEKTGLEPVVFLHYPPVAGSPSAPQICEEIFEVLERHQIRRCYYGHIHGAKARTALQGEFRGVQLTLVSADYLSFRPLRISPPESP